MAAEKYQGPGGVPPSGTVSALGSRVQSRFPRRSSPVITTGAPGAAWPCAASRTPAADSCTDWWPKTCEACFPRVWQRRLD